ncbi:MAG: hypothetical protein SVU32_01280 [Candidatus Nanohaloarchaea archaeon]|nr:hypothetical protein [Candidatus Nanohaloarchaea archaeon]
MGWKAFLKQRSYSWRLRHYIELLEQEVDELPPGYEREKKLFKNDFTRYTHAKTIYAIISLLFYASIVTTITASIGFKINIFQRISGVLGFSTVFILYITSRYLLRMTNLDMENSRARIIAYLTHARIDEERSTADEES